MISRINRLFALLPLSIQAWESPLTFSDANAASTNLAAFRNPAGSAIGSENRIGLGWSEWDRGTASRQRLWSISNQGARHAEGFRYWEGNGPYLARFDVATAWDLAGFLSPGLRPAFVWDGKGADHLLLDAGVDLRPIPQLLAGYWGENIWS